MRTSNLNTIKKDANIIHFNIFGNNKNIRHKLEVSLGKNARSLKLFRYFNFLGVTYYLCGAWIQLHVR